MTTPAPDASQFQNYPFLTPEEFAETCHQLDRRYRRATLGPLRNKWKLNVLTALDTSFALGVEYRTYIQIARPLDAELDLDDDGLSDQLGSFSITPGSRGAAAAAADQEMTYLEDSDHAALHRHLRPAEPPTVTYEIHLHPTYRAPCLWFSLRGLLVDESPMDLDTVFRRLVPEQFKARLRNQGPIGAISIDHHPITSIPTFFIHPCLLGEAMSNFDCSREDYLMVWLGLVGGCVGLWVPKEMATV